MYRTNKVLSLSLSLMLGILGVMAEDNSTIQSYFSKFERLSTGYQNNDYLQKFIGDTLIFEFQNQYLDHFFGEQLDTIWIDRSCKNPKLNTHFFLTNIYKGTKIGDRYVTPSSFINGIPFKLTAVNSYKSGYGCEALLLNLDNKEVVKLNIPSSFPYNFSFTTTKAQRIIKSLINKDIYYSENMPSYDIYITKPEFLRCKVSGGDFRVNIQGSSSPYTDYIIETMCKINAQGNNGENYVFNPIKSLDITSVTPIILTGEEYENQYCDESFDNLNFPFSFNVIPGLASDKKGGVYQAINPMNSYQIPDAYIGGEVILIGDICEVKEEKYYKACLNGKAFFIKDTDVILDNRSKSRLDSLCSQPQHIRNKFFKYQVALSKAMYLDRIKEAIDKVDSYSQYGIAIPRWEVYDESEYTDGTGISISFYNPTEQIVKYITISFQGYNAVDDPVGSLVTKKCIGPIEPEEGASYNFEYAWFTDIVEYAKIKSIKVQYKNGKIKTILKPTKVVFPKGLREAFYSSDPVEKLK